MRIHTRQDSTGMRSHMERRRIGSTRWWIPTPKDVDVVMTHGPPLFRHLDDFSLDKNQNRKHCGCEMLTTAIQRMKPVLHCCGHIHEGRGAMSMDWVTGEFSGARSAVGAANNLEKIMKRGWRKRETLFVNAAIHNSGRALLVDIALSKH
jgi:hypothetical protein